MSDPAEKTRWYRLTPDRLAIGLLVLECLLWLSERFQWQMWHKGYAVLIAVAVVVATMLLTSLWLVLSLFFRWHFQFGIRSLLILTFAVALPFSWLSWEMEKARKQREAVEAIE